MKPSVLGGAAIAAVVAGFAWITVAGGNTLLPSSTGFASAFTSEDNPFLIYGQFARDFAMSPSVVEALRRIVGTPPSDGMVWSRRARQEKWVVNKLEKTSVERQTDVLLTVYDKRPKSTSAANYLAIYAVEDYPCYDSQSNTSWYDMDTEASEDTCDDVYDTCHQSCSRGLWWTPLPGACRLVCGMVRERCNRCLNMSIFSGVMIVGAAFLMWLLDGLWLIMDEWNGPLIALIVGVFFQIVFVHRKLTALSTHISEADLKKRIEDVLKVYIHKKGMEQGTKQKIEPTRKRMEDQRARAGRVSADEDGHAQVSAHINSLVAASLARTAKPSASHGKPSRSKQRSNTQQQPLKGAAFEGTNVGENTTIENEVSVPNPAENLEDAKLGVSVETPPNAA